MSDNEPALITRLIENARDSLREMGRVEVGKAHAVGLPGVHSERPGEITYDHADGRKETRHVPS